MEKKCKECGENKHYTLYPKDKRHPSGHRGRICTTCRNIKQALRCLPIIEEDKKCSKCSILKSWRDFGRDRGSRDGLSRQCRKCLSTSKRLKWSLNKEENSKKRKAYRQANPDRIKKQKATEYKKHREKILARVKANTEANKEARAEYSRNHYSKNRHIYIANARKREERLKDGINDMFTERMREIYQVCETYSKIYNIEYQVDHIVPLTHSKVSGLHVPWNIQVLPRNENQCKKNKFDGTYENESWKGDL